MTMSQGDADSIALLHLDQGIAVTSHASQGKTVDNVIVSAPVAFAQVSQAQLYVSMSRARRSMHLVTDGKEALREAVSRPSERISALELSAPHPFKRDIIALDRVQKQMHAHHIPPIERQARDHGIER
jgi:hypothetical protein